MKQLYFVQSEVRDVEAIRTQYKGQWFRSKLEAQWAKFFDYLGIKWAYESEGYAFEDGTMYLPDFYLPEMKAWFEVKGVMSSDDMHKIEQLIKESGRAVHIGYADGAFLACDLWEDGYDLGHRGDCKGFLSYCSECKKYGFIGENGSWTCPVCHAWDGDHYLNPLTMDGGSDDDYKALWREKAYIDVQASKAKRVGEYQAGYIPIDSAIRIANEALYSLYDSARAEIEYNVRALERSMARP